MTNAREKNQGREINVGGRQVVILGRRGREGVTEAVTFEQRPVGSEKAESRVTCIANL